MITIQSSVLSLILTFLIPVAVALVTKVHLASKWKAAITMILSAVVVLLHRSTVDNGSAILSAKVAFDWAVTTSVAVASYVGFWQQVNVNQAMAPTVGVGPKTPPVA